MRKIISLFRYLSVFLTFVVFQSFALTVYIKSQTYQRVQFMNSTSGLSNRNVQWQHGYKQYFNLASENKNLQAQYEKLLVSSEKSKYLLTPDRDSVIDTLYKQEYSYIAGEVLRSTVHKADNYITANIGKNQGVSKGMGVINHDGLVGFVVEVSQHYCLIKTLLSKRINIDVEVESGQFGFLKWFGQNPIRIQVSGIPNDTELEIGEPIYTRGTGGVFPKGILVGSIKEYDFSEGDADWVIHLEPSVDFRKIKYIYVVNHLLKNELTELEARLD
jgi:rod shape-determining protein MreC